MGKRSNSTDTLHFALAVLARIPKGRAISTTELREQMVSAGIERDLRTVQRMLDTLSVSYPIDRDEGSKPYRYRWQAGARGLSVPGLTTQESLLLALAQQQLASLLPSKLMRSMDGFFEQARSCLSEEDGAHKDRDWLNKVRVVSTTQPLLAPVVDPQVFEAVSNALYADQWLDVSYRNAAGKTTASRVMPLGLAQQGARLYLVCRFEGYEDERCLAVHRLLSACASSLTFERPSDFNIQRFDDDGRFGYGDGTRIRLRITIEKAAGFHLLESRLSTDQEVIELNDAYQITATVVDTAMLDWWLNGFGAALLQVAKEPVGT